MIRLLIADDHPAFRRGLELMLPDADDIEIVGMAETGREQSSWPGRSRRTWS